MWGYRYFDENKMYIQISIEELEQQLEEIHLKGADDDQATKKATNASKAAACKLHNTKQLAKGWISSRGCQLLKLQHRLKQLKKKTKSVFFKISIITNCLKYSECD